MMNKKGILIGVCVLVVAIITSVTVFARGGIQDYSAKNQFFGSKVLSNISTTEAVATIKDGVQEIKTQLRPNEYAALTFQKGVPVKWIIIADEQDINACNNEIIISDYNISKKLEVGENIIEFTPKESGVIRYSCWMGMINSTIAIVDDINNINENQIQEQINSLPQGRGCCGVQR